MKPSSLSQRNRHARIGVWALVIAATAAAVAGWLGLRQGPAPVVAIDAERPAIGARAGVTARFSAVSGGLGRLRLELRQGDRTVTLAESTYPRPNPLTPWRRTAVPEATLEAVVGVTVQGWLQQGEVTLRASADRGGGFLRAAALVTSELRLPVRLDPPRLAVTSKGHFVRQGGSGAVTMRVGDHVVRSGVRAGAWESPSFPLAASPADRFAIYAVPSDLADRAAIVAFAEDDAGNTTERPFVDTLTKVPPRRAVMELSDSFLARVVPAIIAETPGLASGGELVDQFVRINSELRLVNLAEIQALAATTGDRMLWSGAFRQMPASQLQAGFAEQRDYRYRGRTVDRQTHLGLDLVSTRRAPVPAASTGKVVFAGWLGIYGNAVVLDHGCGLISLYGHLSEVRPSVGSMLEAGEPVGLSGATGLAGGDHLHLEIFVGGHSVDPIEWLDPRWIRTALGGKIPLREE